MPRVDLHLHSTASDGEHPPAEVVRRAAAAGVSAIALTDHDTVSGIVEATNAAGTHGVRVVAGCELSVAAPWGELHLLSYFVPLENDTFSRFLIEQRAMRVTRAEEILDRLRRQGVKLDMEHVEDVAGNAPLGRPHVARALIRGNHITNIQEAFDRYLGRGGPAFVPKRLPDLSTACKMVKGLGGVTSAAHLGSRVTRRRVREAQRLGVDAIEVYHPSHDEDAATRLMNWTAELGLLRTGGSDWHGEGMSGAERTLGSPSAPAEWLSEIEALHRERVDLKAQSA